MKKTDLNKLILSALFLSIGIVLPILTGQIKEIGDTLLPMHLPVMLCGLLCGGFYGGAIGLMLPFLRSLMFSMPPMYPNAVWMALELATYGLVIGLLYNKFLKRNIINLYISLIAAMIAGRLIWGIAKSILLGVGGKSFTMEAFILGGFVDSLLGIVLQIILIPVIVTLIEKVRAKHLR